MPSSHDGRVKGWCGNKVCTFCCTWHAGIAQIGERQQDETICECASAKLFMSSNSGASVMRNETIVVICDEREWDSHVTRMIKTSTPCL